MSESRITEMQARLHEALAPTRLEIEDQGHLHVGHAGARDGRGHFLVRIASSKFANLRPLQCHRLVYDALGDLLETDIHAVSIEILGGR